jgi:hypothetical protein
MPDGDCDTGFPAGRSGAAEGLGFLTTNHAKHEKNMKIQELTQQAIAAVDTQDAQRRADLDTKLASNGVRLEHAVWKPTEQMIKPGTIWRTQGYVIAVNYVNTQEETVHVYLNGSLQEPGECPIATFLERFEPVVERITESEAVAHSTKVAIAQQLQALRAALDQVTKSLDFLTSLQR